MTQNMTTGKPSRLILLFSLPMLVGNLFQQFYNIVDTIVVGRFVSYEALAAVGASFAIMTFVNSIIIGLCMGSSILFAHLFGANETKKLTNAITTAFFFIIGFSALLSVLTFTLTKPIVQLFQMPPETVNYAVDYLQFIFAGLIFTGIYNFCAFLLRAFGDSKSPLYFLILACLLNIVLDLVLVLVIPMAVKGVAIATFIAQGFSAVTCFIYTIHKLRQKNISLKNPKFDWPQFKTILEYSVLTSIQQSIMNFGILLVQGLVNTFGAITIAAFSAGVKIDAFAYMPVQDFGNAFSTFVAQNHGANQPSRIQEGLRFCVKSIAVFSLLLSAFIFFFSPFLISLFVNNEPQVVLTGVRYLRIEGLFYILIGYLFMFYGYFRGIGKPNISVLLTILSLGCRVILAYLLAGHLGFSSISISIVIGWLLADICGIYFYKKVTPSSIKKSVAPK